LASSRLALMAARYLRIRAVNNVILVITIVSKSKKGSSKGDGPKLTHQLLIR
jgi:hypothetical protein